MPTEEPQVTSFQPNPWVRRGSALAIALAIAGTVTSGIAAGFGLVLGLYCWRRVRRSGGSHGDADTAIMGVVASAVVLIAWIVAPPFLFNAREGGQLAGCYQRAKVVGEGLSMYVADFDDTFPPGETWCDALAAGYTPSADVFVCPNAPEVRSGYALNKELAGVHIEDALAGDLALLFDATGGWNTTGSLDIFDPRHRGVGLLLRGDGRAQWRRAEEGSGANWSP